VTTISVLTELTPIFIIWYKYKFTFLTFLGMINTKS